MRLQPSWGRGQVSNLLLVMVLPGCQASSVLAPPVLGPDSVLPDSVLRGPDSFTESARRCDFSEAAPRVTRSPRPPSLYRTLCRSQVSTPRAAESAGLLAVRPGRGRGRRRPPLYGHASDCRQPLTVQRSVPTIEVRYLRVRHFAGGCCSDSGCHCAGPAGLGLSDYVGAAQWAGIGPPGHIMGRSGSRPGA
eukprot:765898-Hanusia_phi.AAC.2